MSTTASTVNLDALLSPAKEVNDYMAMFMEERPLPNNLRDAIKYSLLGSGKRVRPILIIHSCRACGSDVSAALPAAAAMEMIHCFSLVHDDLPAMDDDDLRRGRPTLHKHTNEAMAILAGDGMISLAFELLVTKLDAERASKLVLELSAATSNMVAGQVYDTLPDFDDSVEPLARLETIHKNKTGALIRASCRMGAISAGADDEQLASLTTYAEAIGLMFQVVDDLLDVTQSTEQLGKTAGKDVEQGKLTYPSLIGIEASRQEVERLRVQANASLDIFGEAAQPLRDFCEYLAVRTN